MSNEMKLASKVFLFLHLTSHLGFAIDPKDRKLLDLAFLIELKHRNLETPNCPYAALETLQALRAKGISAHIVGHNNRGGPHLVVVTGVNSEGRVLSKGKVYTSLAAYQKLVAFPKFGAHLVPANLLEDALARVRATGQPSSVVPGYGVGPWVDPGPDPRLNTNLDGEHLLALDTGRVWRRSMRIHDERPSKLTPWELQRQRLTAQGEPMWHRQGRLRPSPLKFSSIPGIRAGAGFFGAFPGAYAGGWLENKVFGTPGTFGSRIGGFATSTAAVKAVSPGLSWGQAGKYAFGGPFGGAILEILFNPSPAHAPEFRRGPEWNRANATDD